MGSTCIKIILNSQINEEKVIISLYPFIIIFTIITFIYSDDNITKVPRALQQALFKLTCNDNVRAISNQVTVDMDIDDDDDDDDDGDDDEDYDDDRDDDDDYDDDNNNNDNKSDLNLQNKQLEFDRKPQKETVQTIIKEREPLINFVFPEGSVPGTTITV